MGCGVAIDEVVSNQIPYPDHTIGIGEGVPVDTASQESANAEIFEIVG
jgi:hypothetical protein